MFREVLEAGLIVGIVLAATQGVSKRSAWISGGISTGVAGAVLLAIFAGDLSDAFSGNGQEVFNATVLIVAVLMLGWHNLWMATHGREIARKMEEVGRSVSIGQKSLFAVAVVVAVAVLREGAEVVLFVYGIAASTKEAPASMIAGGLIGIGVGAAIAYVLYRGLLAIPMKHLFTVTSWMIVFLAAGMAGQAAATLAGADIIPSFGYTIWDTSGILPEHDLLGRALHALVGYSDRPMGIKLIAYLVTVAVLSIGGRIVQDRSPQRTAVRPMIDRHSPS